MKVKDLFEKISLTDQQHKLVSAILTAINKAVLGSASRIEQTHSNRNSIIKGHVVDNMETFVTTALPKELKTYIELIVKKGIKFELKNYENDSTDGSAGFNIIYLNLNIYNKLLHQLIKDIIKYIEDYDELTHNNIVNILQDFKPSDISINIIKHISSILIHELVHIHQHIPQSHKTVHGLGTEYRSYFIKNKQKFYDMLYSKLDQSVRRLAYLASPQEIPAFAHNLAMDLLDIVLDGYTIDYIYKNNPEILPHIITNLKDILQDSRNYQENQYFKDYKQFKDSKNAKVFKRFMKVVYQEIAQHIYRAQELYNKHQKGHYDDES